ncbi:MAG: YHS domain-containing protein, partial [Vicinamibacteria bacterium]
MVHESKPTPEIDPVCGMTVSPERAAGHHEHRGKTYYFCSKGCLARFREDPEKFLEGEEIPEPASAQEVAYTCPMDPEVVQKGPGACPKCGMALEPLTPTSATRTEWTCPMHPSIVRSEPRSCPI